VAAGALPLDFEPMEVPFDEAVPLFKARLPAIVAMLQGRELGGLAGDRALQRCAAFPIPVLSAAVSTGAARRAAECGAGILIEGMSTVERVRSICDAYDAAGGLGAKVVIRRVWLGEPRAWAVARQRAVYESYAGVDRLAAADQTITATDPSELADRLHAVRLETGAGALNLRVHLPGISRGDVRLQLSALAEEVLPRLSELWSKARPSA